MNLIKPSFEIIEQEPGLLGVYKQIELAGRTCYKSEDKITDDSAEVFVQKMVDSKHYAMLEHGTVYLKMPILDRTSYRIDSYVENPYSKTKIGSMESNPIYYYITTNLRVLVENGWLDDLKYLCEPTEHYEKRVTVKFICDRGVSHEFVRHRKMSFAQESTRYCNYSKDKFNKEITFILPPWMDDAQLGHHDPSVIISQAYGFLPFECEPGEFEEVLFMESLAHSEINYNTLIENGWKPQQARSVLTTSLKTELVMTGFISDWKHFFNLRAIGTTGAPHPQAKELAEPLMNEFIKREYL